MSDKINLLRRRFVHRGDVFAEQWHRPGKGTGYYPIKKDGQPLPLTDKYLEQHINHTKTLGVYQLDKQNTVRWMCLDVDLSKKSVLSPEVGQMLVRQHVLALAKRMKAVDIPFLVEQSGSKGYHLWVFFSQPVEARYAFALGQWCNAEAFDADITVEIFPKQNVVGSFGNLVKMPLSIHKKTGVECLFVNHRWEPLPDQWEALKHVKVISQDALREFLSYHQIDIAAQPEPREASTDGVGKYTPPCFVRMMAEGLQEGYVDVGLFRIACYFRDRGLPMDMAKIAIEQLAERSSQVEWIPEYVEAKIESAYAKAYSPLPCSEPLLDHFCSSSCSLFRNKVVKRCGGVYRPEMIGKLSRD